ncbi:hypothetical protein LCGC14_0458160 [marine sediment metagenome]|uniref:Uncharacterized protein n=1 Tax=marine sediment metagenome TaxID=412755 RepID=A0A0F9VPW3_9ZZZZ
MTATNGEVMTEPGDLTLDPGGFGFEGPVTTSLGPPVLEMVEEGRLLGKLLWSDGKFSFEGGAEESAKAFFDYLTKLGDIYHCPCCSKGAS